MGTVSIILRKGDFIKHVLLFILVLTAYSMPSHADMIRINASSITNPAVQKMEDDDKYFYMYVKRTCGILAPVKVLDLEWETFVDSATALLDLNPKYYTERFSKDNLEGYSFTVHRIITSPASKIALDECYGNDQTLKALYITMLTNNDHDATFAGIAANVIGWGAADALIATVLKKVGWAPIALRLKKLGKSDEEIKTISTRVFKNTRSVVDLSLLGLLVAGFYRSHAQNKDKIAGENDLFSCHSEIERAQNMAGDDIQAYAHNHSDYWKSSAIDDTKSLIAVLNDCSQQKISAKEKLEIKDDLEKYSNILAFFGETAGDAK